MKKFIALILILVMVLSLSTVAFAGAVYGGTLASDTWNVVCRIFGYENGQTSLKGLNKNLISLVRTIVGTYDNTIGGITGGIMTMADSFNVNTKYPVVNRVARAIGWCVERVAYSFHYGHAIQGEK